MTKLRFSWYFVSLYTTGCNHAVTVLRDLHVILDHTLGDLGRGKGTPEAGRGWILMLWSFSEHSFQIHSQRPVQNQFKNYVFGCSQCIVWNNPQNLKHTCPLVRDATSWCQFWVETLDLESFSPPTSPWSALRGDGEGVYVRIYILPEPPLLVWDRYVESLWPQKAKIASLPVSFCIFLSPVWKKRQVRPLGGLCARAHRAGKQARECWCPSGLWWLWSVNCVEGPRVGLGTWRLLLSGWNRGVGSPSLQVLESNRRSESIRSQVTKECLFHASRCAALRAQRSTSMLPHRFKYSNRLAWHHCGEMLLYPCQVWIA